MQTFVMHTTLAHRTQTEFEDGGGSGDVDDMCKRSISTLTILPAHLWFNDGVMHWSKLFYYCIVI